MAKATQKGYCYLCGAALTKAGMRTHLLKTHGRESGTQRCRLIRAEGSNPNYWLYLDMPVNAPLKSLDDFLRKIWLECCGHMSAFFEGRYEEIPMSRKLERFEDGRTLQYEYDFGSTTELTVTFMGDTYRPPQREHVRLLARNMPFSFTCDKCGQPATWVDTMEFYRSENSFLCDACAEKEEHELLLPVTNSPRMGVCGYAGKLDRYGYIPLKLIKGEKE